MYAFLHHHFANRANQDQPVLLLWDDLSAHRIESIQLNVVLVPVSPSCTSVCQPADICWNMPLKARPRARWIENLQECQVGIKFKLNPPKRKDVTEWFVAAWEGLSQAVIKSSFSFIFKHTPEEQQNLPKISNFPSLSLRCEWILTQSTRSQAGEVDNP
ncbi:hypothetical protein P3T76_002008 [Phytophthora citrophthora]|uniref:DDE-1 domain-containing protein n=1 Tax=Phytophthora citrophthora TaxID=4793 RepID=A0AAD9GXQ5_9STRA|nr:hypothetical protein P3T76_002008 [Phytophthora citrophthora]